VEIAPLEGLVGEALNGRRSAAISSGFRHRARLGGRRRSAMIAFAVERHLREAAIRLALGARPSMLRRYTFWPHARGAGAAQA
jgi:hypothetical protein